MSSEENRILFEGQSYSVRAGESVLDCLLRQGVAVPSFCRGGVCQSCALQAHPSCRSAIPPRAQQGLRESAKRSGVLLSCVCYPTSTLELERTEVVQRYTSRVTTLERLSPAVLRVRLERPHGFEYQAGQFVQLVRPSDGLMRPYSLASLPSDPELELHVALLENGRMSRWLAESPGAPVTLKGPLGECCYVAGEPDRALLLVGTSTGLAPLLGVVRAAREAGHRGPITLFHGAKEASGLYAASELTRLCQELPNLRVSCALLPEGAAVDPTDSATSQRGSPAITWRVGALDQLLFSEYPKLDDHRLYFCGNPELVARLKKRAYLAGASLSRIHSDPFLPPHPPQAAPT